jgi:hypothetical protein
MIYTVNRRLGFYDYFGARNKKDTYYVLNIIETSRKMGIMND